MSSYSIIIIALLLQGCVPEGDDVYTARRRIALSYRGKEESVISSCSDERPSKNGYWFIHDDHCYFYSCSKTLDWYEAEYQCARRDSHLVSITSEDEAEFTSLVIGVGRLYGCRGRDTWMGLIPDGSDGDFGYIWSDGSGQVSYTPKKSKLRNVCGYRKAKDGRWDGASCTERTKNFLCKKKVRDPTENNRKSVVCPSETPGYGRWYSNNDQCYFYSCTETSTWFQALSKCSGMNARLVSIVNKNENYFLKYLQSVNQDNGCATQGAWIGLARDNSDEAYAWIDGRGRLKWRRWTRGQPRGCRGKCRTGIQRFKDGRWALQSPLTAEKFTFFCWRER